MATIIIDMSNYIPGWGEAVVQVPTADLTFTGNTTIGDAEGDTLTINATTTISNGLTMGSSFADTMILNSRIATGSAAGSAVSIDASVDTYAEGIELRYTMDDWADVATFTECTGMYLRMESTETNSAGSVYGLHALGVSNNVADTQYLWGAFFEAYIKGAAGATVSGMYGVQGELTWDAATASCTITEAACVRAKITGGTCGDYTNIHGYILIAGDMNAGSRTYGNAIYVLDDPGMGGTCGWTVGLNLAANCTTGISIAGTTTTGIEFSGTVTEGIVFSAATLSPGSAGGDSSRAFEIGSRTDEFTLVFAGGDGVENFEPVQMKVDVTGTIPASESKINMIYQQLTHDTVDMDTLRLKCADFTVSVAKNVKDVYAYQGEIGFSGTSAIGGEAAVMGLVANCGSGTLTGNVRGLIISMQGASMPADCLGIELRSTGTTLAEGIRISGTPLITVGIAMGNQANDNEGPTHAFFFPSGPGADVGPVVQSAESGDGAGSIKIKIGSATKYIQYWDNAA